MQQQTIEINLEKIAEYPEWKEMLAEIIFAENFNPWNIDVCTLSDSYIRKIREMEKLNLKISANVILAASIFLRCKSDYWKLTEEEPQNFGMEIPDAVIQELVIPELSPSFRSTTRRITLDELISAVEDAIEREKKKSRREPRPVFPQEALLHMIGTTEFFEKRLTGFYAKIVENADKEGLVLFSSLLREKNAKEVVESLVLSLHLANKQKISMWQEEFFGEIFIMLDGKGKEQDAGNN